MSQQLSKALFQKKSLKNALVKFKFPSDLEQRHQIMIKWVEALNSGTLNQVKINNCRMMYIFDSFNSSKSHAINIHF
jgi:hypothetical protein